MKYSEADKNRQIFLREKGFYHGNIDGLWGVKSKAAENKYQAIHGETILNTDGTVNKKYLLPYISTSQKYEFYGGVGENQTRIKTPYPLFLSWDTNVKITSFSCHKKISKHLLTAMRVIQLHYGNEKIKELGLDLFGGCLNIRKMRGGNSYSSHSWGAAVDWDTANNVMRMRPIKTAMARPENKEFCDIMLANGFKTIEYDLQHWEYDFV